MVGFGAGGIEKIEQIRVQFNGAEAPGRPQVNDGRGGRSNAVVLVGVLRDTSQVRIFYGTRNLRSA